MSPEAGGPAASSMQRHLVGLAVRAGGQPSPQGENRRQGKAKVTGENDSRRVGPVGRAQIIEEALF